MRDTQGPGIPLILPPFDPEELALRFEEGFPLEFCACPSFDPGLVAGLVRSGFIPMAASFGPGLEYLMPKLHLERCALDPGQVRITRTARRESGRYALSVSSSFPEVLAACVETHGEGWLRPPLVECFLGLAARGEVGGARLLSFELREEGHLVAGEIGALVGSCYTSWSGFKRRSGAGTVQLMALARALERAGVGLWDLGMPLAYKLELGAELLSRADFLARFHAARSGAADFGFLPLGARELVDGKGQGGH
jgi:Leu/Phe-tRNA-protein transferase